jgi:hypothetical protein
MDEPFSVLEKQKRLNVFYYLGHLTSRSIFHNAELRFFLFFSLNCVFLYQFEFPFRAHFSIIYFQATNTAIFQKALLAA